MLSPKITQSQRTLGVSPSTLPADDPRRAEFNRLQQPIGLPSARAAARRAGAALLGNERLISRNGGHVQPRRRPLEQFASRSPASLTVIAAMERAVTALKTLPDYSWVGIYLLDGNELVLGPYRRQAVAAHAHSRSDAASAARPPRKRPRSSWTTSMRIRGIWPAVSRPSRRSWCQSCGQRGARRDRRRQRSPRGVRAAIDKYARSRGRLLAERIGRDPPELTPTYVSNDHADSRRRCWPRSGRSGRAHLSCRGARHRMGALRRRRGRVQALQSVAAGRSCSTRSNATKWRSRAR